MPTACVSRHARLWIETFAFCIATPKIWSAATRGCGLKRVLKTTRRTYRRRSAATRGCGLKHQLKSALRLPRTVSRHARLWIETVHQICIKNNEVVSRHARLWIETSDLES